MKSNGSSQQEFGFVGCVVCNHARRNAQRPAAPSDQQLTEANDEDQHAGIRGTRIRLPRILSLAVSDAKIRKASSYMAVVAIEDKIDRAVRRDRRRYSKVAMR